MTNPATDDARTHTGALATATTAIAVLFVLALTAGPAEPATDTDTHTTICTTEPK